MKIRRTYPQPDSPQPHIGPRERALAVCKYVLNLEPEEAVKHANFALLVAAFEQVERVGWNKACNRLRIDGPPAILLDHMPESIVPLLTAETEVELPMQAFTKDGL